MKIYFLLLFLFFTEKKSFSEQNQKVEKYSSKGFNIKNEISKEDWIFFFQRTSPWHEKMWKEQTSKGFVLQDWHWTYRLAWIRICSLEPFSDCQDIFKQALLDKGSAIRTQAANYLAKIYEKTSERWVLKALEAAYLLPSNKCLTKPEKTCFRVLNAMMEVDQKKDQVKKLAYKHEKTKEYFLKMQ